VSTPADILSTALSDIFNSMGSDVTYNGNVIKGDFRGYTRTINLDAGEIEEGGPSVDLLIDDCAGIKKADQLTIDGDTYKVTSMEKRDYGVITAYLVKI